MKREIYKPATLFPSAVLSDVINGDLLSAVHRTVGRSHQNLSHYYEPRPILCFVS